MTQHLAHHLISYDAYFFDLDGTLLNTTPDIARAINIVRASEGLPILEESFIEAGVGYGATVLLKHCFSDSFESRSKQLRDSFTSAYQANICVDTKPFADAVSCLNYLKKLDKKIVLITNKPTRFAEPLLECLAWKTHFDLLIYGDSYEEKKPSALPINRAMEELSLHPSSVLFIGDTEVDVQAAKAAQVHVAIVQRGRVAEEVEKGTFGKDAFCIHLKDFEEQG